MSKKRSVKSENDNSGFLAATLFAVSALIIAMSMSDGDGVSMLLDSGVSTSQNEAGNLGNQKKMEHKKNLVNKHLYYTNEKILAKQKELQIQVFQAPKVGTFIGPSVREQNHTIDMTSDLNEYSAAQDTASRKEISYNSPHSVIQGQIRDQELSIAAQKAESDAFIKQFLDNARLNGYIVILDENHVVVDVKPIPNFQKNLQNGNMSRFPTNQDLLNNPDNGNTSGVR